MTDPIADMLTQIRNALMVKKPEVILPHSKLKENLAKVLQKNGWLSGYQVEEAQGFRKLRLSLNYDTSGEALISGIKRVSKPGQRIYAGSKELSQYRAGIGSVIVSTPKGLMTDTEARKEKLGGEVICKIW